MDPISMDLDIYVYKNLHAENKEDVIEKMLNVVSDRESTRYKIIFKINIS